MKQMLKEDGAINLSVSVSESPEDKEGERERALCASAIRLAAETEMYQKARLRVMTQSAKVTLKPSCRDRGATDMK